MIEMKVYRAVDEITTSPDTDYAVFMTENHLDSLADLESRMEGVAYWGAVVPYLIKDKTIIEDGVMVMPLAQGASFAFTCDMRCSSADIASRMDISDGIDSLLLFVDGLSPYMDPFITAFDTCSGGLAVLGTGVGCKDFTQRPVVFDREGLYQDRALVVGTGMRLQIAAKHGWRTIHGPIVVTRAEENILHELNGQPAFDVYRNILRSLENVEIGREDFFDVAKSYPFGVSTSRGGEIIIRDPFMANEDGSLTIVSSVKNEDTLYVMKGEKAELIDSSRRLSREAFAQATGRQAILFDCISRVLFLEDDFTQEIEAVFVNSGKPDLSVLGITSIGEITNIGHDEIKIMNKTTLLGVVESV